MQLVGWVYTAECGYYDSSRSCSCSCDNDANDDVHHIVGEAAARPPRPERSHLQEKWKRSISQWCGRYSCRRRPCRVHVVTPGPASLARLQNTGVAKNFALESAAPSLTDPVTLVFIGDDAIARPGCAQAIRRALFHLRPDTPATS